MTSPVRRFYLERSGDTLPLMNDEREQARRRLQMRLAEKNVQIADLTRTVRDLEGRANRAEHVAREAWRHANHLSHCQFRTRSRR